MSYELAFDPRALKEWHKLGATIQALFKQKLKQVVLHPRNEASRLREFSDCYKIKLRASGYRLVYQVQDAQITVLVIAIGRREKSAVYHQADKRLKD